MLRNCYAACLFNFDGSLMEVDMNSNDQSRLTKRQTRQPREDKGQEKREAAAKTPGKTNDWDRDIVHGDGDSLGIEPGSK